MELLVSRNDIEEVRWLEVLREEADSWMITGPLEKGRSLLELKGQLEERFACRAGEVGSPQGSDGSIESVPELEKSCKSC